jgi:hypothetical protein
MATSIRDLISGKEDFNTDDPREHSRLLSQDSRIEFDAWKSDPYWTSEECENVITFFWMDEKEKMHWRGEVISHDLRGELNEPEFRTRFLNVTMNQIGLFLRTFDDLTRVAWMRVRSQVITHNAIQWKYCPDDFWMDQYKGSGNFGMIHGAPGSGKSDLCVALMEKALRVNHRAVTTILIPKDARPVGMTYSSSFRKIMLSCIQNLQAGFITDVFMDELGSIMNRKRALSGRYVNVEDFVRIIRKLGGNLFGAIQDQQSTPTLITAFKPVVYNKFNKRTMTVKTGSSFNTVVGVERTKLPFETGDPAALTVDVDMTALNSYIGSLPEDVDKYSAIYSFLEGSNRKPTEIERNIAIKTLYLMGNTQEWIGDLFGVNQSTISDVLAKWLV